MLLRFFGRGEFQPVGASNFNLICVKVCMAAFNFICHALQVAHVHVHVLPAHARAPALLPLEDVQFGQQQCEVQPPARL